MAGWSDEATARLRESLQAADDDTVLSACSDFVKVARSDAALTTADALGVIRSLQEYRRTNLVPAVAESAIARGLDGTPIIHRYALALLDDGQVTVARRLLDGLPSTVKNGDFEIRGAMARVHKERFLATTRVTDAAQALGEAVTTYHVTYKRALRKGLRDDWTYHGVNAAALLHRAAVDGIAVEKFADPMSESRAIARAIVAAAVADEGGDPWLAASGSEAALCLHDVPLSSALMHRYLDRARPTAFAINSTLRQLQRLWRLDDDTADPSGGAPLVASLQQRLLSADGELEIGAVVKPPVDPIPVPVVEVSESTMHDERVMQAEDIRSLSWVHCGVARCRSVARLESWQAIPPGLRQTYQKPVGTGFVVASADLGAPASWPSHVLLTNRHVIDQVSNLEGLRAHFFTQPHARSYVGGLTLELDCTGAGVDLVILGIPDQAGVEPLPMRSTFPDHLYTERAKRHTYVIGHPHGRDQIGLTLKGSTLSTPDAPAESAARHAWYRTSTADGNSGSPVFDDEWQAIAVHVGYDDAEGFKANKGVRLDFLRDLVSNLR